MRRALLPKLLVAVIVLLALLFALVKLDVWYTTRRAERAAPPPESGEPGSTPVPGPGSATPDAEVEP